MDPSLTPLVPETLLKKRRSIEELADKKSLNRSQSKKKRVVRGEDIKIKRPEQLVTHFRIREGSQNRLKRVQRKNEQKKAPPVSTDCIKSTVGLIVRIHEGRNASAEIKTLLRNLGLTKKYDAVFSRLSAEDIARLQPLDSYLSFGYISLKSVSELISKRAYTTIKGIRKPLSDNLIIEEILGDKGILCLNDLAHEIFTLGPEFETSKQLLSPFKLSSPVGKFEKKILNIHDLVDNRRGFQKEGLDSFLEKIL